MTETAKEKTYREANEPLPKNTDLDLLKPSGFYKIDLNETIQPETIASNHDTWGGFIYHQENRKVERKHK